MSGSISKAESEKVVSVDDEYKQNKEGIISGNFNPQVFVEHYIANLSRPRPLPENQENWPYLEVRQKKVYKDLLSRLSFGEAAEGGMATRLLAVAESAADRESLKLYAGEETRHGEEFFWLADQLQLGINPAKPDLGGWAAMFVASLFNFGRVVDIANLILVAEVVTIPIYRELANRSGHPLVKAVLSNIVRDEAGHLRYHGKRLQAHLHSLDQNQRRHQLLEKLKLKLVHQLGLFSILLASTILLARPVRELTGLSWTQMLQIIEVDYNKFYKNDLAGLRSRWLFRLFFFVASVRLPFSTSAHQRVGSPLVGENKTRQAGAVEPN